MRRHMQYIYTFVQADKDMQARNNMRSWTDWGMSSILNSRRYLLLVRLMDSTLARRRMHWN